MARTAIDVRKTPQRRERREPDQALARRAGVASRYVLGLEDPRDAAGVLGVLAELSIPLGYLLLLPSASARSYCAYVGLGRHDVADLAIRFAAQGVHVARGEELEHAPGRCADASLDAPVRRHAPPPPQGASAGAALARRRGR